MAKRLEAYEAQTVPVIQHYERRGPVHRVDGYRDVNEVFAEIEQYLAERRNDHAPLVRRNGDHAPRVQHRGRDPRHPGRTHEARRHHQGTGPRGRENLRKRGAKSAFLGYHGFPATLCVSVNEEVVHGIPGKRVLNEGDIVGLDFGAIVDGYYGDAARTVAVGRCRPRPSD